MGYENRNTFLFGTVERMTEIPAPVRGMSASPSGWSEQSTFLTGGAHSRRSFDSHKIYDMTWSDSTSPEVAQTLKSYADGSYGRGLIYFIDPSTYTGNVLPSRWADPSLAVGYEGRGLIYGVDPAPVASTYPPTYGLPLRGAEYTLPSSVPTGFRGNEESLFIPIPRGMTLLLGSITSGGGLTLSGMPVSASGANMTGSVFTAAGAQARPDGRFNYVSPVIPSGSPGNFPFISGVRLWYNRAFSNVSTGRLFGSIARLVPSEWVTDPRYVAKLDEVRTKPWVGGMGHSGVQFQGPPTWNTRTSAFGGQIGTSASLIEVGDWYYS